MSGPRNLSTAFMYSWAQRPDTVVVDEPLYGFYLKHTGIQHPGRDETMQTMSCDLTEVSEQMKESDYGSPVVFFKHMAHHMIGVDYGLMRHFQNIFFIRDPKKVLASYTERIEQPTITDIGLAIQYELYQFALENHYPAIVIDSGELLKDPEKVLKQMCTVLDIPFYKQMLNWQAGARKEDGAWAKYWYKGVHQSTGFQKPSEKEIQLKPQVQAVYEEALPFYQALYQASIKA